MEHERAELLPFRRRAAQSLDAARSGDPLDLFPPEPTIVSPAPAPPADPLGEFPAEATWDSVRAILGVLLAIGLILASLYLAVR